MEEMVWFLTANKMVEGLAPKDCEILFSFLDGNQDGSISVHELCLIIQGVTLSLEARMRSFSVEFDA